MTTITATMTLRDGTPVPSGTVDFFLSGLGNGDAFLGAAPVSNGQASVKWTPSAGGRTVLSAGYFDGLPDYLPVAAGTVVTVSPGIGVDLGGVCL
ncbi:Ig-like domain repeat protein [Nocardia sp. NPDC052566]|uniref:Ig-like domain repeat protein n=1 Tax=Nocardia sp. NPDC052566 TaxID=3364330 RepID=UPI0037C75A4A